MCPSSDGRAQLVMSWRTWWNHRKENSPGRLVETIKRANRKWNPVQTKSKTLLTKKDRTYSSVQSRCVSLLRQHVCSFTGHWKVWCQWGFVSLPGPLKVSTHYVLYVPHLAWLGLNMVASWSCLVYSVGVWSSNRFHYKDFPLHDLFSVKEHYAALHIYFSHNHTNIEQQRWRHTLRCGFYVVSATIHGADVSTWISLDIFSMGNCNSDGLAPGTAFHTAFTFIELLGTNCVHDPGMTVS